MAEQPPLFFVGMGIAGIGFILVMIFGIILTVRAFQTSVGWGFAYLFLVGIGPLVFVIKHWKAAGGPFLKAIASSAMVGVGFAIMSMTGVALEVPSEEEPTPLEAPAVPAPQ